MRTVLLPGVSNTAAFRAVSMANHLNTKLPEGPVSQISSATWPCCGQGRRPRPARQMVGHRGQRDGEELLIM